MLVDLSTAMLSKNRACTGRMTTIRDLQGPAKVFFDKSTIGHHGPDPASAAELPVKTRGCFVSCVHTILKITTRRLREDHFLQSSSSDFQYSSSRIAALEARESCLALAGPPPAQIVVFIAAASAWALRFCTQSNDLLLKQNVAFSFFLFWLTVFFLINSFE